ncbi:MAG: sugar phosphate isomerase/epimerase [Pirellulales bacterium]|nr:sugar phosphate isomerase/epimerase [Pirellulales bacterium]
MTSQTDTLAEAAKPGDAKGRRPIGVCDWMILKRQKLGAFGRSQEIGADGIELDMGSLGARETFENALADPDVQRQFLDESQTTGVQICSVAMSGFYAQSFAERPTYQRMVGDCLATMTALGVRIAFLPLGVQGDLVKRPELRPAVVERLRQVGARAAEAGVVVGIETAFDAAEERRLLEEIDSPTIRSYFNFANALQAGRDVCQELRTLGCKYVCQIHCTDEDGVLLEHNRRLDLHAVKETLDELQWYGWLVMERSRDATRTRDVVGNFGANARYLKAVFGEGGTE